MTNPRTAAEFTLGDDEYQVVRYGAPEAREDWLTLFETLLGCSRDDAVVGYDAMFPGGYDPNGSDDVAFVLVDPEESR